MTSKIEQIDQIVLPDLTLGRATRSTNENSTKQGGDWGSLEELNKAMENKK